MPSLPLNPEQHGIITARTSTLTMIAGDDPATRNGRPPPCKDHRVLGDHRTPVFALRLARVYGDDPLARCVEIRLEKEDRAFVSDERVSGAEVVYELDHLRVEVWRQRLACHGGRKPKQGSGREKTGSTHCREHARLVDRGVHG
jgi:hypothetical protein